MFYYCFYLRGGVFYDTIITSNSVLGERKMQKILVFSVLALMSGAAIAAPSIPSQNYVDEVDANTRKYVDEDKVSVSENANQTMAGTYEVTGALNVATQPLPKSVAHVEE